MTRSGDFSQPLVVHLVSSDTTEATVPATVTILAGDSFATFAINAVNDAQIDGLQNVTITASVAPAGGPLSLDPTFGTNGVATTPFEMKVNPPSGEVAVQPDGKLVIAGEDPLTGSWRISRLNADGSLDTSFGTNGVTTTQFSTSTVYPRPRIVVLQPDGKILVGGRISVSNAPALARYNADGSIDTTFGTNGIANFGVTQIGVEDVALNSDGTIMVALTVLNGTAFFKVAKFTSTGQLDTTFGPGGIRTSTVSATTASINLLANGGYIMAGSNRVAKFLASGGLDLSFGTNGVVTLNFGASAQAVGSRILADGKILLGYYIGGTGGPGDNFGAARLNADGTLDTTFNGTGLVVTDIRGFLDFPSSMVVQPDGKLILAGYSVDNLGRYDVALVRYGINGQLDTTFDGDGKFTTSLVNETFEMFMSIALDGDRLVGLGGFASDFRMARYVLPGVGATATAWLSVYDDETTMFLVDTLMDENDGNFNAGDLSLRKALLIAPSGATISFATSLTGGTIVLSQGRITLPRSVTINGLGAAKLGISGNNFRASFSSRRERRSRCGT